MSATIAGQVLLIALAGYGAGTIGVRFCAGVRAGWRAAPHDEPPARAQADLLWGDDAPATVPLRITIAPAREAWRCGLCSRPIRVGESHSHTAEQWLRLREPRPTT